MTHTGCRHKIAFERGPEGEYIIRMSPPGTPKMASGHLHQAKKEMLLAIRDIIDRAIESEEGTAKADNS